MSSARFSSQEGADRLGFRLRARRVLGRRFRGGRLGQAAVTRFLERCEGKITREFLLAETENVVGIERQQPDPAQYPVVHCTSDGPGAGHVGQPVFDPLPVRLESGAHGRRGRIEFVGQPRREVRAEAVGKRLAAHSGIGQVAQRPTRHLTGRLRQVLLGLIEDCGNAPHVGEDAFRTRLRKRRRLLDEPAQSAEHRTAQHAEGRN